ncbi:serine hydrolase domain-containing protein [Sphingomonas endolithica]|uniref:serine hydrolase domain-containing protein n=1 Tax=Sphingomonas endolithica TaxID=2972485 RepID=UPI0021B0772A|nr:serine hydrolase [Sphingomonas sp. ZFBP2030]
MHKTLSLIALVVAAPATAQQIAPPAPTPYHRAIAAGYKAALYCAGIFNGGRTPAQIDGQELRGIYPEYDQIVPTLKAEIDPRAATVSVAFDAILPPRMASWTSGAGCTTWPIGYTPPVVPLTHATPPKPKGADPRPWPMGDAGIAPRPSPTLGTAVGAAFDHATYGKGDTVGVVVLNDGKIVAERYAEGFGPYVSNRTWSVGKSIAGSLLGIGLARHALTPTTRLALWDKMGDPRGAITYDDVLRMASGLHSDTAGNRTDAVYFGGTAVSEQVPSWALEAKPGSRFRYANNDILLAMLSLHVVESGEAFSAFPARALFAPLGMSHTVAERDWLGDFVISSQIWSTARDLARLGQFWLQDGIWAGKRILPAGWMTYMTTPSGPQPESGPGYGATMWLFGPKQGLPEGSYAAQGNRGQYVMVIPSKKLVIVRRGEDSGSARFDIAKFAVDVTAAIK